MLHGVMVLHEVVVCKWSNGVAWSNCALHVE